MRLKLLVKKTVIEDRGYLEIPDIVYDKHMNGLTPPQRLRWAIYERDNKKCRVCNRDLLFDTNWKAPSKNNSVIIHHLKKISYCGPGDHDPNGLISVCRPCHNDIHQGNIILTREEHEA
jgi:hypothetical protein